MSGRGFRSRDVAVDELLFRNDSTGLVDVSDTSGIRLKPGGGRGLRLDDVRLRGGELRAAALDPAARALSATARRHRSATDGALGALAGAAIKASVHSHGNTIYAMMVLAGWCTTIARGRRRAEAGPVTASSAGPP